jgi:hypothetical protein
MGNRSITTLPHDALMRNHANAVIDLYFQIKTLVQATSTLSSIAGALLVR